MASTHYLYSDAYFISHHIIRKYSHFENAEKDGYFAAVIIQRLWRGYSTRKIIKNWNRAARIIQKHVRGWLVRWHMPDIYREYIEWRTQEYYRKSASRIQAAWKGYYVRKYVLSVEKVVEQRMKVEKKNAKMESIINIAFENMKTNRSKANEEEARKWVVYILYKTHHMLRTNCIPGIYSLPGTKELSLIENLLKSVQFAPYVKELRQEYKKLYEKYQKQEPYQFRGAKFHKLEDCYRKRYRDVRRKEAGKERDLGGFKLTPKIDQPAYERLLMTQEAYVPRRPGEVQRAVDRSKFKGSKDFDLHVLATAKKPTKPPPYYIDLWEQTCSLHNIKKDLICLGRNEKAAENLKESLFS